MSGLESGGEREPIEKPLTPEQAEVSRKSLMKLKA